MTSRTTTDPGWVRQGARGRRPRTGAASLGVVLMLLTGVVPASGVPEHPAVQGRAVSTGAAGMTPAHGTTPARVLTALRPLGGNLPAVVTPAVPPPPEPPVGSVVRNAVTDRQEIVVPDARRTAVLIGDSQATGHDSWPQLALRSLGYDVRFFGAGGTGFVVDNQAIGAPNYGDALTGGAWVLPHGDPALVVVEGGGNDAARGVSNGDLVAHADALLLELERTYPRSRVVMIGTLSRTPEDGGGRRAEVNGLLRDLAATRDVAFVSPGDWLTTHQLENFLADAVHLTPEGNQKAAVVLEEGLSALKLGADDVATDPSRWPHGKRPLE